MAECLQMRKIFTGGKQKYTKVAGTVVLSPLQWHTVPCGRCAFCLQNRRSQWMFRIHHEMRSQLHPGWFITMTYDEKHLPRSVERDNGLIEFCSSGKPSLRFRDVQLFLKQVRKAKYYCKYICVGEYGGETQRPHYHILLWTDADPIKLEKIWHRGHFHVGRLNMASAMYTLKYIIQPKQVLDPSREKPRAQFSRGLGLDFLSKAQYKHLTEDYDNPQVFSYVDGRKVALPLYYKRKIFTKEQMRKQASKAKWDSIRERRKYMRVLIAKGIPNTKEYIKMLRTEQSRRIFEKTKFNQFL